jgi:hypothetical protein
MPHFPLCICPDEDVRETILFDIPASRYVVLGAWEIWRKFDRDETIYETNDLEQARFVAREESESSAEDAFDVITLLDRWLNRELPYRRTVSSTRPISTRVGARRAA